MTRLNIVGFESGVLASEVESVTGAAAISTLESRSGSFSVHMPDAGGGSRFQIYGINSAGASAQWSAANCYVDFYIMVRGAPNALAQIVSIATATPSSQVAVDMTTSRTLQLWYTNGSNVKTNIGSPSAALAYNVWHRVTLIGTALSTGGSSTATLKLNGTTVATASSLTVLATPTVSTQTFWGTASSRATDYYLDDIRIDDTSEPAVSGIYFTRFYDEGSSTDWSKSSAAAAEALVEDMYAPNTSDYIYSSTAGQVHLFQLRTFSSWFPSGTVHTVKAHTYAQESAGTTSSTSIRMRQNSTNADSGGANLPGSWFWLHYMRGTAPDGTAWTMDKLDALEVGVVLNSTTATTVQVATLYVYAEMTPDDGTWAYISWGNQFFTYSQGGKSEWPDSFDVFDLRTASYNVTPYLLSVDIQRGRSTVTEEFAPSRASLVLNNASGTFNLETNITATGYPVRVFAAANGNLYEMFFGFVVRERQTHTPSGGNMLHIEALDGLEWLRNEHVEFIGTASAAISTTLGYAVDTTQLGYQLGFNATTLERRWRIDTTSRTLTRFWHQGDGLAAVRKLAYESTEDWFFTDRNGFFRYRSKDWLDKMSTLGTIPRQSSILFERSELGVGRPRVVFAKFTTSGSTTVLYTHSGDPLPIPNGTSRIRIDYGSPAAAHASLTATTDFTANTSADGSGTNITGSVTIGTSGGYFWQTGGELVVTNSSGSAGYLTFLQWRGSVITHDQSQVRYASTAPYTTYTYEFMDSATDAQAVANALFGVYSQDRVVIEMTPADADEREFVHKADIGYVITPNTTTGQYPSDLSTARRVQGVRWSYSPQNGERVAWDVTTV